MLCYTSVALANDAKPAPTVIDKTVGLLIWECGAIAQADLIGGAIIPPIPPSLTPECRTIGESIGALPPKDE